MKFLVNGRNDKDANVIFKPYFMKNLLRIIILLLICSQSAVSQKFNFKRAYYEEGNSVVKVKGFVVVSDTLITINTNGTKSALPVALIGDAPGFKEYKVSLPKNSSYEIKITLSESNLSKKETHALIYETRDNFSGIFTKLMYYLIPNSD